MRSYVHTKLLPGVTAEEVPPHGREFRRDQVFSDGEYVGEVVYVENPDGITYGWRPAKSSASSKLSCRVVAVSQLPKLQKAGV